MFQTSVGKRISQMNGTWVLNDSVISYSFPEIAASRLLYVVQRVWETCPSSTTKHRRSKCTSLNEWFLFLPLTEDFILEQFVPQCPVSRGTSGAKYKTSIKDTKWCCLVIYWLGEVKCCLELNSWQTMEKKEGFSRERDISAHSDFIHTV